MRPPPGWLVGLLAGWLIDWLMQSLPGFCKLVENLPRLHYQILVSVLLAAHPLPRTYIHGLGHTGSRGRRGLAHDPRAFIRLICERERGNGYPKYLAWANDRGTMGGGT